MKKILTQVSIAVTLFLCVALLMSYTKPAVPDEKEYTIVYSGAVGKGAEERFGQLVTQKLSEGWKCQGGVSLASNYYMQAMVK